MPMFVSISLRCSANRQGNAARHVDSGRYRVLRQSTSSGRGVSTFSEQHTVVVESLTKTQVTAIEGASFSCQRLMSTGSHFYWRNARRGPEWVMNSCKTCDSCGRAGQLTLSRNAFNWDNRLAVREHPHLVRISRCTLGGEAPRSVDTPEMGAEIFQEVAGHLRPNSSRRLEEALASTNGTGHPCFAAILRKGMHLILGCPRVCVNGIPAAPVR